MYENAAAKRSLDRMFLSREQTLQLTDAGYFCSLYWYQLCTYGQGFRRFSGIAGRAMPVNGC